MLRVLVLTERARNNRLNSHQGLQGSSLLSLLFIEIVRFVIRSIDSATCRRGLENTLVELAA